MKAPLYLLLNKNTNSTSAPYSEQFRIFDDFEKCIEVAIGLGWETTDFIPFNHTIGICNIQRCGKVWLEIFPLEVS